MAMFNVLRASIRCPSCGNESGMEVEFRGIGITDMREYRIGQQVEWAPGKTTLRKGARPSDGSMNGEGYAECPVCGRDFFLDVRIRADVIDSVAINTTKPGLKPT